MKKLLYIIGFFMFATAALQPVITLGQDDQFSAEEEDLPFSSARIFSKIWGGDHPEADFGTSFGPEDEADIGEDLYLMVYDKTELQPQQQAVKETAGKYALDEGELMRVLNGNYDIIADKKPGLTQEELMAKIVEIQQEHAWRKEMAVLKAQVKAQVETSEIFANGDVGDSGFDLINDLTIIEELLFLHTNPIDVGNAYTSVSLGALLPPSGEAGAPVVATGPGSPAPGGAEGTGTATAAEEAGQAPGASPTDAAGGVNPNACFADETFHDALEAFEEKSKTDPNYKDVSATQTETGEDTGQAQQPLTGADFFPSLPDPDYSGLVPAGPDEWLKDKLCNEVFCLQVNFVEKPATSAYASSDNCIACHVEKINDVLKNVVTHTLAPSKVPGNLGESAQCKKAVATSFGAVSMNFYAIPMPVVTPTNDDLIFGTSVEDEWMEFCQRTDFFPFDTCKTPDEVKDEVAERGYVPPPILTDRAAKQAISQTPDNATQTDVIRRINETITGYTLQSNEELIAMQAQRKTDESLIFFNPLITELDQMNFYFKKIQDVIHSLHEQVQGFPGNQACTEINNKKECE